MQGYAEQFEYYPLTDYSSDKQFHLMRWLKKNHCLGSRQEKLTAKQKENFLAGPGIRFSMLDHSGIGFFPMSKKEEVLTQITRDVESESPMALSQYAYFEEGARFVVDVDSQRIIEEDEFARFARVLNDTFEAYFEDFATKPIYIFMSSCGPRIKKDKNVVSLHLVAHVALTFAQAMQLGKGYQERLLASGLIDMSKLDVDMGIYDPKSQSVHLRMIYSSKLEVCVICHDSPDARKTCLLCRGNKWVRSKFCYVPCAALLGTEDKFKETHQNFGMIIRNHSIWATPEEKRRDYRIPEGDPRWEPVVAKPARPLKLQTKTEVRHDNQVYLRLQEEIRAHIRNGDQPWRQIRVVSIDVDQGKPAMIKIDGVGSTICQYSGRDHGSLDKGRKFYFLLYRRNNMLQMRCNSEKLPDCKNGHKNESTVIQFPISADLVNDVFGIPNAPDFASCANGKRQLEDAELLRMQKVFKLRK